MSAAQPSSAAACPASSRKAANPGARGRPAKEPRGKIDIDGEITHANSLANVMKRLSHAAKVAERNSQRMKARLVRKASKLSPQDLDRIAVLKRCGLLTPGAESEEPAGAETPPMRRRFPMEDTPEAKVFKRLAEVAAKIPGASALLKQMETFVQPAPGHELGSGASSSASASSSAASSSATPVVLPDAARLPPGSREDSQNMAEDDFEDRFDPPEESQAMTEE